MRQGQSTIEFTFVMVAIFLLIYGLILVVRWTGVDLAERRYMFEKTLTTGTNAQQQLAPDFYRTKRINPVFKDGY